MQFLLLEVVVDLGFQKPSLVVPTIPPVRLRNQMHHVHYVKHWNNYSSFQLPVLCRSTGTVAPGTRYKVLCSLTYGTIGRQFQFSPVDTATLNCFCSCVSFCQT